MIKDKIGVFGKKQVEIYISPAILSETLIVLKRRGASDQQIVQVLAELNSLANLVAPEKKLSIIKGGDDVSI